MLLRYGTHTQTNIYKLDMIQRDELDTPVTVGTPISSVTEMVRHLGWEPLAARRRAYLFMIYKIALMLVGEPWGQDYKRFLARLGAQLTICDQKLRNFLCSSTLSLRFVLNQVFLFLYSLGPWAGWLTTTKRMTRGFHAWKYIHIYSQPTSTTSIIPLS